MKSNDLKASHLLRQAKYNPIQEPKRHSLFIRLLATGFGSGYSPFAPGTMGSLVAIPIYLGLWWLCSQLIFPVLGYVVVVVILIVAGFWICDQAEGIFQQKDSSFIVLDEIIGFLICMTAISPNLLLTAIGFFIFRVFDVWKPFYISRLQDFPGGLGVMLDDAACGVLTCGILHAISVLRALNA